MAYDDLRRRSRWMIRALEWDDTRARYPNLWRDGMPCQVLVFATVAARLRLGDLVAVYQPASQKHPDRSERFVGISRVAGLRRSHLEGSIWVDLETAHRFSPPLDLGAAPGRVFLCCDPGWPAREVALFRGVFDAAVALGWKPSRDEMEAPGRGAEKGAAPEPEAVESAAPEIPGAGVEARVREEAEESDARNDRASHAPAWAGPSPGTRLFAGADLSGDMRDPKDATWLAVAELRDGGLTLVRLEPTGRAGLEGALRNPDAALRETEAIGLDFPFGLPVPFAESLLGGSFPDEGWWALARKLERVSRPLYLIALHEFREGHGEIKRLTDERAGGFSPLRRVHPDLGPMTYHGIRMIAEERSRYALRPFESAKGRLLLEVYPGAAIRKLGSQRDVGEKSAAIVEALGRAAWLPVRIDGALRRRCMTSRDALDAVVAARCAAAAVLSGEADRGPDDLAPGEGLRVRREGWIYGLADGESGPGIAADPVGGSRGPVPPEPQGDGA